jgi:lipopolysaccharide transport system ATP-binding protein
MKLKENGCTILFCSHSLFQIESLCSRAIWLEKGEIYADGNAANIVSQYQDFLNKIDTPESESINNTNLSNVQGHARFINVSVKLDGDSEKPLKGTSKRSTLSIYGTFTSDILLPCPSAAVTISAQDGRILSSAGAWNDNIKINRDKDGTGKFAIHFPNIALLKGKYNVGIYLFCEKGLHTYDWADPVATFELEQIGIEQGIVSLSHKWEVEAIK